MRQSIAIVLIALVCFLLPFVFAGISASAEVVPVEPVTADYVLPQDFSGWIGMWRVSLLANIDALGSGYQFVGVAFDAQNDFFFVMIPSQGWFIVSSISVTFNSSGGLVQYSSSDGEVDDSVSVAEDDVAFLYIPTYDTLSQSPSIVVTYFTNQGQYFPDSSLPGIDQYAMVRVDNPVAFGIEIGATMDPSGNYDRGYAAGQNYANNNVNVNSASYQAGYQAGLEVPEYSFLTLISAVLDAPIRALFGFTDADGVIHPGLFNIEFLGVNMASFILSLFTLAIIITVIRLILGGK